MRTDTLSEALAGTLARAAVVAAGLLLAVSTSSVSAADKHAPSHEREGGFSVRVQQTPEMIPVDIGYVREEVAAPQPASRLDVEAEDAGIAGALMGIKENNAGGRFVGHLYGLDVETVSSSEEAVDALKKLYESGHSYIVVDASAPTLL